MFKNLIISLFLLFINVSCLNAEIIKKIIINGNKNINDASITLFSGLKIGDDINEVELNNSVKELYNTNFFKNIDVELKNSNLIFTVTENQIIQNVIITGIKRKPVQKLLYSEISLKDSSPFLLYKAKEDVKKIKNILQKVGYYFSNVESFLIENDNGTVNLTYDIKMGKKSFINEILFLGDKKIKSGKLLNVIVTEENKFWKILSNKKYLNKERIDLDKRLLINYYKNKGYYNVVVENSTIIKNDNENFKLIFNIDGGDKFFFDEFTINLPDDYDAKYFHKIEKKLNKNKGSPYSFKILENVLNEIERIAANESYEFIDATIDETIVKNNKVNVVIN